ncbi:hypothetical protein [Paenibacillus filicis]
MTTSMPTTSEEGRLTKYSRHAASVHHFQYTGYAADDQVLCTGGREAY